MDITRRDPFTGKVNTLDIPITQAQVDRWEGGELIQNVMPDISADDREFILTGITPETWDEMIGDGYARGGQ